MSMDYDDAGDADAPSWPPPAPVASVRSQTVIPPPGADSLPPLVSSLRPPPDREDIESDYAPRDSYVRPLSARPSPPPSSPVFVFLITWILLGLLCAFMAYLMLTRIFGLTF